MYTYGVPYVYTPRCARDEAGRVSRDGEKSPSPMISIVQCQQSAASAKYVTVVYNARQWRENGISSQRPNSAKISHARVEFSDRVNFPPDFIRGTIVAIISFFFFFQFASSTIRYGVRNFFLSTRKSLQIYSAENLTGGFIPSRQSSFNKRRLRIFIQMQKRAPRRESVNFAVKFLAW